MYFCCGTAVARLGVETLEPHTSEFKFCPEPKCRRRVQYSYRSEDNTYLYPWKHTAEPTVLDDF